MKKTNRIAIFAAMIVLTATLFSACRRGPERRFEIKGKVVSVDQAQRQVMLAHEKIPGYMDAMTMPFNIGDEWAVSVLAPGQNVDATLVVRGDRSWIEGLRISKTEDSKDSVVSNPGPRIGDAVPDFGLLNQNSKRIHLHQYRGQPLLVTFIYTRCPVPDFCPRTSKNFSDIYRSLQSRSTSGKDPHLLTVSFDTEYDNPSVLREYALRYMNPERFDRWEFATGSPDEIKKIAGYFGLSYWRESGQIIHNLVTALIGADGTIKKIYNGNRWEADRILADLE